MIAQGKEQGQVVLTARQKLLQKHGGERVVEGQATQAELAARPKKFQRDSLGQAIVQDHDEEFCGPDEEVDQAAGNPFENLPPMFFDMPPAKVAHGVHTTANASDLGHFQRKTSTNAKRSPKKGAGWLGGPGDYGGALGPGRGGFHMGKLDF